MKEKINSLFETGNYREIIRIVEESPNLIDTDIVDAIGAHDSGQYALAAFAEGRFDIVETYGRAVIKFLDRMNLTHDKLYWALVRAITDAMNANGKLSLAYFFLKRRIVHLNEPGAQLRLTELRRNLASKITGWINWISLVGGLPLVFLQTIFKIMPPFISILVLGGVIVLNVIVRVKSNQIEEKIYKLL